VIRYFLDGLTAGLVQGLAIGCLLVAVIAIFLYMVFGP